MMRLDPISKTKSLRKILKNIATKKRSVIRQEMEFPVVIKIGRNLSQRKRTLPSTMSSRVRK